MRAVTTRIPEDDDELLAELETEAGADRSEIVRRLIHQGLVEWRREKALDALREHQVTVRKAASMADVSYVEMLSLAAEADIDIGYNDAELARDMERFS